MSTLYTFLAHHPFSELAVLIAVVIIFSFFMKTLKQPLLIGYIIAGIVIGPSGLSLLQHTEQVEMFSHLGVTLLLFMVGLGLNTDVIKDLGKASLIIGVGQVLFTTIIGFLIALLLGFDTVTSIYISVALAFSSTIIIIKLLSDKGVLDELYGKISIGMLIVQDLIAMILLMVLSSLPSGGETVQWGTFTIELAAKMIGVLFVTVFITKYFLPRVVKSIAKSPEFLFIFALGRCLFYAASMDLIGFSLEIGALLAGLTLASLPYRLEISSRMKPLRDFFIMLFFVFLGSELQFLNISTIMWPIVIFTLFVLIGKPLIVMMLMGFLGYKKKNSMMAGFTIAQISEFSFILMGLGLALGHFSESNIVSMITLIGLLTTIGSSYYFTKSSFIYTHLKKRLVIFERKDTYADGQFKSDQENYEIIVFGNHRTGNNIVQMLQKNNKAFLIVDYDPDTIKKLHDEGMLCLYGDASDNDLYDEINLKQVKMVISTIHDYDTNALILDKIKMTGSEIVTIFSARTLYDAENLYLEGANYVVVPHIISGTHTAMVIENYEYDIEKYAKHKIDDFMVMQ